MIPASPVIWQKKRKSLSGVSTMWLGEVINHTGQGSREALKQANLTGWSRKHYRLFKSAGPSGP